MPRVSVVIPTYNCVEFLPEALESVLAQTYKDYEIIVIDDGSTDQTRELAESYVQQYPGRVRYFYQDNQGFISRNTGIHFARGEFIAFLDSDDRWLPDRLALGMEIFAGNTNLGLAHGNILWMKENGELIGPAHRQDKFLERNLFENLFMQKADIFCSTVLLRKSCCDVVGVFDPDLARLGSEDRDLWLRIAEKFPVRYIPKILTYYRIREDSMSRDQEKLLKARIHIVEKYCRHPRYSHLRRPALGMIYRDMADHYLSAGKFVAARQNYWEAIFCRPLSFWNWINLLKAALRIQNKKGA